jgi:hypothetical protein
MSFTPIAGPTMLLKLSTGNTLTAVGSSPATVPAMGWKLQIDGKLVDISNFQTGRTPALTLVDVDLSFTLVHDITAPATDSDLMNLRPGVLFTAQCYTDTAKYYTLTAMISTINPGIDSLEDVGKLPVTAKISGTLTYPVNLA